MASIGVRCKHPGCVRKRRAPAKFCSRHHQFTFKEDHPHIIKQQETFVEEVGVLQSFNMDAEGDKVTRWREACEMIIGRRQCNTRRVEVTVTGKSKSHQAVQSIINYDIMTDVRIGECIGLERWKVIQPSILMAPKKSNMTKHYCIGPLHRDSSAREEGLFVFLLYLDDVTNDTGRVDVYPNSCAVDQDFKHPNRTLKQLQLQGFRAQKLVSRRGMLHVFDARLLHQAFPNTTSRDRFNLHWFVGGENWELEGMKVVYKNY
jgi:hypothetical protein